MKRLYLYLKNRLETGKVSGLCRTLLFLGVGITSTVWFLVRVIPKPSRAAYPCMQTAAPLMSAFVLYLLSLSGLWAGFRRLSASIRSRRYAWAFASLLAILACGAVLTVENSVELVAQTVRGGKEPRMAWGRNHPVGEARGIYPGRVAWAHAPGAATWDQKDGRWYEDRWNSQEAADWMMQASLLALTGEADEAAAWKALFRDFNGRNGKGKKGYAPGEKVAIKVNMNNTFEYADNEQLNASPHLTLSLLRSLVRQGGVPQHCITLFDASRFMTDALFHKCHAEFPDIVYMDNEGTQGRTKAAYVSEAIPYSADNGRLARGLAKCAVEADYLINMALLKGHGGQGVTLCAKNWYGATDIDRNFRKNQHNNFNQDRGGKPRYMTFTDYMGHKDLGGKAMLFLIDGLYGSKEVNGAPSGKWKMQPFGDDWPCSLFASQDGVAIDAVGIDFLSSEFPAMADVDYCDMYLVEAALADQPLSGTYYDPEQDGTRLKSLGVLEHWDNATDKRYSRNLGKAEGIELVYRKR